MPKYSDAYKVWAAETALERDSVREGATIAKVSQNALRAWIKQLRSGKLRVNGTVAALLHVGKTTICSNCNAANEGNAAYCRNYGSFFANGKAIERS